MNPRSARSKMDWYKQAARSTQELSHVEFRVLMALASYSDKDGKNAHPGNSRLSADTGIEQRNLRRYLKRLEESGWIVTTSAGGNHIRKGTATTYMLTIPSKGGNGEQKGGNDYPAREVATTLPSGYISGPIDHSEGKPSASPASGDGEKVIQPKIRDWSRFDELEHLEQWLDTNLNGWRGGHQLETAVWMMWEDDRHPKAILNYACHQMGYKLKAA